MFTEQQLQGILLGLGRFSVSVQRDEDRTVGYAIKPSIIFRFKDVSFGDALKRTFLQYEIRTNFKLRESKTRPHPILSITNLVSLFRMKDLQLIFPMDKDGNVVFFIEVLDRMELREHMTHEGVEAILELKEKMK